MKQHSPIQTDLDRMDHAEKDALILQVIEALERLQRRVEAREGQIKKNSRHSSKPRPRRDEARNRRTRVVAANARVVGNQIILVRRGG